MPPKKPLDEHVRGRTFRARRHHGLLAGAAVPWGFLAELQRDYQLASSDAERRAVAVRFERVVDNLDDSGGGEWTAAQHMLVTIGPFEPELVHDDGRREPTTELGREWAGWDKRDGVRFRAQHDEQQSCLTPDDRDTIRRRAKRAKVGEHEMLDRLRSGRRAPQPPGWGALAG